MINQTPGRNQIPQVADSTTPNVIGPGGRTPNVIGPGGRTPNVIGPGG